MQSKKVLFIDDDDVSDNIDTITRNIRSSGYELHATVINPIDQYFLRKNPDSGLLEADFSVLKAELETNHFSLRYDVVACDFNFSKDPLNGYDVLKWIINTSNTKRATIRKSLFVSYSSEKDKFVENFLNSDELIKLIKLNIHSFYNRPQLSRELSRLLLREAQSLDLSNLIRDELEKYKECKFKNIYPKFEGKTLGDIAIEVENDSYHGMEFQKYMIELTVAHILDLNSVK